MKKLMAMLLVLTLLFANTVIAETIDLSTLTDEELAIQTNALIAEQLKRGTAITDILDFTQIGNEQLAGLNEYISAELNLRGYVPPRTTLERGSKGEDVKVLQQRLIELNYLSGTADGDFGGKTASAVELFQSEVGLPVTGIADEATQTALFADDAPKATVYLELDFKAISRDPDKYEGNNYTFSGKVLQVLEEEYETSTIVSMRIATKGNYDNVVYVIYVREDGESRILEDDYVTVYGTSGGLYSYTSTMGKEITLPIFMADSVTTK